MDNLRNKVIKMFDEEVKGEIPLKTVLKMLSMDLPVPHGFISTKDMNNLGLQYFPEKTDKNKDKPMYRST